MVLEGARAAKPQSYLHDGKLLHKAQGPSFLPNVKRSAPYASRTSLPLILIIIVTLCPVVR